MLARCSKLIWLKKYRFWVSVEQYKKLQPMFGGELHTGTASSHIWKGNFEQIFAQSLTFLKVAKQKQDVSSGWTLSSHRSLLTWKPPRGRRVTVKTCSWTIGQQNWGPIDWHHSLPHMNEWSRCGSHRPLTMKQFPQQCRGHRKQFGLNEGEEAWKHLHHRLFTLFVWKQWEEASWAKWNLTGAKYWVWP